MGNYPTLEYVANLPAYWVGPENYETWDGAKKMKLSILKKKKSLKNYSTYGFCYKITN